MKIYTKSGDDGKTGLFHGPRVLKDDARIEAYGTVDELCSVIGLARVAHVSSQIDMVLERIQHQLFSLGAELATPHPEQHGTHLIGATETGWVEATIDELDDQLTRLFLLHDDRPLGMAWFRCAEAMAPGTVPTS